MKKYTFLIFLICFHVICLSVLSQTHKINNYPLKIGNYFVFKKIEYVAFPYVYNVSYVKCNIIKDTIIYNRQYFVFNNFPPAIPINTLWWFRLDSASGRLLKFDSTRNCNNYIFETLWDRHTIFLVSDSWFAVFGKSRAQVRPIAANTMSINLMPMNGTTMPPSP